ncbi:MAG: hypothetical protein Q7U04_12635 [Bacteriovorax sp.]|nr:hypothetical protein [Bacteriovorax sp.]
MANKSIVLALFFLVNLFSSPLSAEVLKTINVSMPTNYGTFFGEIHYSEKDLALALRVERIVKEDLIKVINYFEYVPYDVVHFNIDPYMRLTNGNARTFPTNIINLYNFPANNLEHLIAMENWLQGLVLHEFVHITHLDQTRDYLNTGRQIFGTIAKIPAGIVPRWFTEGIAVWGESHLINGGRLNNSLFNKDLLIQFKKDKFCKTIDCLDTPGVFPNGQLAYWAGAHFLEYLENKKPKTIKCLVEMNSAAIPFFLNNAFEACAGEKAQDLFKKFHEEFITNEAPQTPEKKFWGANVGNVFGDDDFQKGHVLDGEKVFKVERQKEREALVVYDLKDNISFSAQFTAPISDVSSMVDIDSENRLLLVSFNDNAQYRTHNKVWKLINPETLLIEQTLKFPRDPSYVVPLGGESYLTFSYWENHWQAQRDGDLLRTFPSNYNISFVKKLDEQLLLKFNDANGESSLVLSDFRVQRLNVIYKSKKAFDMPVISENYLVIREDGELKLLEYDKKIQISSLPNNLLNRITFANFNEERSLVLENQLKSIEMTPAETDKYFKKDKSQTKIIETPEFKTLPEPTNSYASDKAEAYPRLDHLIPHYWFLAFGSSDNLSSIGAMTDFVDPMEIHSLAATVFLYPSVSRIGGTLDYTHKMIKVSDQWFVSAYADQDYSKTDFSPVINLSRELKFKTKYNFLFKQWIYTPGFFAGTQTTEDFISNRNVKNMGTSQNISYQALTYDEFFQYFIGGASLQVNRANIGEGYIYTQTVAEAGMRLKQDLMGFVKGSYSKLYKSDFYRGVVYGGGISDYTKTRVHEFYGVPYGNAYGNELFSARLTFDYNFWNIYRGKNFVPFFFKEAHLLLGHDSLYANRIYLDGSLLKDKMLNAFFIGPRLKMNLFYFVPINIDLIFSTVAHPNGKNVNQVDFTIATDMF